MRRRPRLPRAGAIAALAATAGVAAGVAALAAPIGRAIAQPSPNGQARLQGAYLVTGVVTHAVGIPGEHRGQQVTRTWTFVPRCPVGPCAVVGLIRPRAGGVDHLTLHLRGPGYYVGRATFFAAVRCRRRLYRRGERVPFRITVRITAAMLEGPTLVATGFHATYYNRKRIGLTRCFSPPSHDAARYTGAPPPAPAPSIRSVDSTPPSKAS